MFTASLFGATATLVHVSRASTPDLFVVQDAAVPGFREQRERVRSALKSSGVRVQPTGRILLQDVAPLACDSAMDLAVAAEVASGLEDFPEASGAGLVFWGGLSLSGEVLPARGILPVALAARGADKALVVARGCGSQAVVVEGLTVYEVPTLWEALNLLRSREGFRPVSLETVTAQFGSRRLAIDFADVAGQGAVKRALEVAAAGGHGVALVGPPGSGKSMLARRLPTILPEMTVGERLETSAVYSAVGVLAENAPLVEGRPFRAPHHTISEGGMVGTVSGACGRLGEVCLAHNGVLFLDDAPEFRRGVWEVLRAPLDEGAVALRSGGQTMDVPAYFQLVTSESPCPCGYRGDRSRKCSCSGVEISRHARSVPGFIRQHTPIRVSVPALGWSETRMADRGETSEVVRARVTAARERQLARGRLNAEADPGALPPLTEEGLAFLNGLDADAFRVAVELPRIATTIADLAGADEVQEEHLREAWGLMNPTTWHWNSMPPDETVG